MSKKKTTATSQPTTLREAIVYFADEDNALEYVVSRRWPDGVTCPRCGSEKVYYLKTQRRWKCSQAHERQQFTAKVGTIFEDSPLPFSKWLPAVWMIANCKNGVSSYEIHRALGVTQKTAWFMLQRIRLAMQDGGFVKMGGGGGGTVEVDETFIGGKSRNMHKHKRAEKITGTGGAGKALVFGLLDRETGKVRVRHLPDRKRVTVQGEIKEHVEKGAAVYTDEFVSYLGLEEEYVHEFVNHAEEYVRGAVHTNGLENFWSLLKRGLRGTYVSVEPFHLFRYLDEQAFRYNERKDEDGDAGRFSTVMGQVDRKRLTYRELIADPKPTAPAPLPA